ncbi:MAG: hypothetical protein HDQ92_00380 [Desulfovibrio sp.]|nr:hypothetical protein [Desulfovibrio sp.]
MSGTRIASTPRAGMHALAFQGISASASFPQIRDMLLRKFGDAYVLLFARPVENAADGTIDWYSPVQGEAQPLSQLPPDKQNAARGQLAHMGSEIMRYAEELIHSQDPLKVTRGNILKLALCYPDDSALYAVGDQPVFTCWGFGPGTPGVEPANLSRLAVPRAAAEPAPETSEAPPPPPPAAPDPQKRGGCLLWLLPLALACALCFLLFTSFAGLPAPSGTAFLHLDGPDFLRAPEGPQKEIDARSAEIDSLRRRAEEHAALCRPADPVAPAPEAENQLVIPENASDPAFLAGSWRCDTGLANKRTGEAVVFEFAFDANGKGQGIIHEQHDRCTGEATARFRDGLLHIELGPQQCQNSANSYAPVSIDCQGTAGGRSLCVGTNDDGTRWDADFRRVR